MQAVNIPDMPASIALVDFSHMLVVQFKARANDSGPNDAGQATLNQLAGVRDSVERVVVCLDSPPYWRTQKYAQYKEGREREPELGAIIRWTLDRLDADGYQLARSRGQEADDVIATLARYYSDAGCDDVRIIGADKDALQLVSDTIRVFVPQERGEYEVRGPEYVAKKYEVRPDQFALSLAINGDKADAIPGIDGIGWKGAAKLINTYGAPEKMAEACAAACSEAQAAGKEPPAFWRRYAAGMLDLHRWLELTTLRTDAELERDPMSYLEHREARQLTDTSVDELLDAWEPGPDELAEERETMAAALPVGPEPPRPAPLIGADPKAGEHLRRAAAERSSASNSASATRTPTATTPRPTAGTSTAPSRPTEPTSSATPTRAPAPTPAAASRPSAATPQESAPTAGTPTPAEPPRKRSPEDRILSGEFDDRASTALTKAPVGQNEWNMALQPRTCGEALVIAKTLYNSRRYSQHGTDAGIFAMIATGRELGLTMMQTLNGTHIVKDKPVFGWQMVKALAERDPDCEWLLCVHADDKSATWKTKHRIHGELENSYTIERAEKAGLPRQNPAWKDKPQEMLTKTALTKGCWQWYTRALLGMPLEDEGRDDQ